MSVDFKFYERPERKVLGTVASLAGIGGTITPTAASLKDSNKSIALVLLRADGNSGLVVLSKPLTAMLRSKEVSLKQICKLEVVEHTIGAKFANAGTTINLVVQPTTTGGNVPSIKVDELTNKDAFPVMSNEINYSELVAF